MQKYIYLFCYVLTDREGSIHLDRCEIGTDTEISYLSELEIFEARVLRIHRDRAVSCKLTSPPYLLRVEQIDPDEKHNGELDALGG